ncbi:MAG: ribosomal protein L11 methyltransferase [Spirochaetes bacterium ADurb.Bin110]|nr:MAG: ribosomal protein L11 methyltransferase [Spirochaetes bacterium ADurb.Bin110]
MSASTNKPDYSFCQLDPLVNRTVDFAYRGARLKFELSHSLFSSFDIDEGTRFLLKEIANEPGIIHAHRLLDAGCGIGVIGISLAASCPEMNVVLRDRDFRAVAFSARNAERNGLGIRLFGLDGQQHILCQKKRFAKIKIEQRKAGDLIAEPGLLCEPDKRGPYDAVVSNLPAKAGVNVLEHYFYFVCTELLQPGGTFAFVIVAPLADMACIWCAKAGLSLLRAISTKNHMVAIAQSPREVQVDKTSSNGWISTYLRSHTERQLARASLDWDGFLGLPEFNEPSFVTVCALSLAQKVFAGLLVRRALIVEPGVGIAPMWMEKVLGTEEIVLISHDVLALTASIHNLEKMSSLKAIAMLDPMLPIISPSISEKSSAQETLSAQKEKQVSAGQELSPASIDVALFFLEDIPRYNTASACWQLTEKALKRGGVAIFSGTSTHCERVIREKPLGFSKLPYTDQKKGWHAIAFRRD